MLRIVKELQPKQKVAIEEIGFSSLLQLRCIKINHGLCLSLVNSFNLYSYTLEVYNTCIKLSPIDVKFIIGLKAKGLKIDMNKNISNKKYLCNKYCDKKMAIVINYIRKSN